MAQAETQTPSKNEAAPAADACEAKSPKRRADAERNRAKLIAAATAQFAECGSDLRMESVAKRAGVGIGTLYRHFPTRDALAEAAYRNEVDQLCASAGELLADREPDDALEEWMHRWAGYAHAKRGMKGALQPMMESNSDLFLQSKADLHAAAGSLLTAAAEAGTIRSDLDADDLLLSMRGLWQIIDQPDWEQRSDRLIRLLMDGLRAGATP